MRLVRLDISLCCRELLLQIVLLYRIVLCVVLLISYQVSSSSRVRNTGYLSLFLEQLYSLLSKDVPYLYRGESRVFAIVETFLLTICEIV
jgi:hypothetical protein